MSIHLIRYDTPSRGVPPAVIGTLAGHAGQRGQCLVVQHCDSEARMRDALERAVHERADAVLLDPGPLDTPALHALAAGLPVPVVEVHDDAAVPWEPSLARDAIHGYGAQGYVLALSIALERLGGDDGAGDVHVGT